MATRTMLHERNSHVRVKKLGVKRLTLRSALSSLGSTVAGFGLPRILGWIAVLLAVAVAGCASLPGGGISKDSPPEAKRVVVTERVNARWELLIKGDVDRAYAFMSTGSQAAYPLNLYKAKIRPGNWRAAKIDSIDCEAELCKVKVVLTYDHRMMKGVQVPLEESWIIEKGTAWYVFQPQS
jgi:hypothetical protein